jgi:hypothetical protein
MKASLLFSLSSMILPAAIFACQVTLNGKDKTNEFFILDNVTGESYVDCMGRSKCRDAVITDCPVIKCFDNEACSSAQIINFTDSVLCEGLHACHRTEMLAADSITDSEQTVSCVGSGACDVAQIVGENIKQVTCSGVKACRKVLIQGSKLVKCHDGHDTTVACEGFATLETECLYCGKNGCASHINLCRYKIIGGNDTETNKYQKCQPETLVGDCPTELEAELHLELSGREEIDTDQEDGTRRIRQLR